MKILVVGSGAREHAICDALTSEKNKIFCAPGNDGMQLMGINTVHIKETDFSELVNFAISENIAYTIVGPEAPLVDGIVDFFEARGLRIFGPNKYAAQIEGSKSFTKNLLKMASIPTAEYQEFFDFNEAMRFLNNKKTDFPIVIKADGLASGKGVYIANNVDDSRKIVSELLREHKFETNKIVVEEFLDGEEFSLMAFVNNGKYYPMPIAQDYKKLHDNDEGPNTGGMGAVCPVQNISNSTYETAVNKVIRPFVEILAEENIKYTGILYAGLIKTKNGIKVIEFNVRFGDPETEVVLPRLKNNFSEVILSILNDDDPEIEWDDQGINLGVFVSSSGYPENPQINENLGSVDSFEDAKCKLNFAGVVRKNGSMYSNGGRLYLMSSHANDLVDARQKIYNELEKLDTKNVFYRKDIGKNSI
ncbi:phosphoribosylamine--glycine ligase [Companilactobacillus allii]|uniref:Phosphoribosylamine--glycine ligase n=1 Tax=Companilactobacillus allii TaxID=1847728 RepID=A0A1P8Q490_9LACO|nr:phosphoribosylamine--glycine ligase [Companilactobacillus allii]APX72619.1 phosphoribosylamine--glycine ligase [Companilactobacillus allii]USQ69723.1 phosphoribosylamine--glycine ligase [Companilactobacillus allii]